MTTMTPEAWFDRFASALANETGATGRARAPIVGEDERDALLDLARVAAHTSERWAAPISTYLVGTVLNDRSSEERAAVIRRLVAVLDPVTAGETAGAGEATGGASPAPGRD